MTLHIAALASGNGTNINAILDLIEKNRLNARLRVVLSNRTDAPVLEKIRQRGIPVWAQDHRDFASREDFDKAMLAVVRSAEADTIVLAGYMLRLTPLFLQAFPERILNIHPALLPSFPGLHGGLDSLTYGVRISGVSVHFVNEVPDNGPIIIQAATPVRSTDTLDTLMPRIQSLEYRIYPQALQWLADNRLRIDGRNVTLLPSKPPRIGLASVGQNPLGPWLISPPLEDF